jgi:hydroxyacylglutathione hydrolase
MALQVLVETVGPFGENTYFLIDEESKETVLVDPGDEAARLLRIVRRQQLVVRYILNTHGHLDHVCAVAEMKAATQAPFYVHRADVPLVEALPEQAALFGLVPPAVPKIDGYLAEGDTFTFGKGPERIDVLETPGHTPGGVTLRVGDHLFVGDTLFAGSIGRTDLPGGDFSTLIRSIRERLLVLPDACEVHSGHGPDSTIGRERRTNPFLTGAS